MIPQIKFVRLVHHCVVILDVVLNYVPNMPMMHYTFGDTPALIDYVTHKDTKKTTQQAGPPQYSRT
jgi:hypothetical protein